MTLSTLQRPLSSYHYGQAVMKGGHSSGVASGLLYRTEAGEVCVISRTPVMGAPAFYYYPTLLAAWRSYRAGRDRQVGSLAAGRHLDARISGLREELARLELLREQP